MLLYKYRAEAYSAHEALKTAQRLDLTGRAQGSAGARQRGPKAAQAQGTFTPEGVGSRLRENFSAAVLHDAALVPTLLSDQHCVVPNTA